jgi:DNA-binding transcriptional ArsR family regulator
MEGPGSGFLPLFRSDQQHALLCFLFVLMPEGHMTMTQLAAATGISASTVGREIGRLETSGIVTVELIGKAKLVRPNWNSPMAQPLRMMLTQTCGPLRELGELRSVDGVVDAWIFGSWAERYQGTPGAYPNDIDVVLVGDRIDFLEVQMVCSRAARNLQAISGAPMLDVNPIIVSRADWERTDPDAFTSRVRGSALIEIPRPVAYPVTTAEPFKVPNVLVGSS